MGASGHDDALSSSNETCGSRARALCAPAPRLCSCALPRYCVGDVALAPGEAPLVSYEEELGEGQFYEVLKQRVDAHFKNASRPWEKARTAVRVCACYATPYQRCCC